VNQAWLWLTSPANWHGSQGIPVRILEHLAYTGIAFGLAAAIALPLGVIIGHTGRGAFAVISLGNFGRALPTLGLLVFAYVLVTSSIDWLVPLVILAIPPILVNSYEGVLGVDPDLKDAARGMGMTGRQVLARVEIPVALPLIMLGLRIAAIQVVATATIAAYIGVGGLGRYIIDGLANNDYAEVAGGAVVVVVLALVVQAAFLFLQRFTVSPGLRGQARPS
jgi:osmoprotectant transport system permease protein